MDDDSTPIIVGVGQYTEHLDADDYIGLSPQELAAKACIRAMEDAEICVGDFPIDTLAAVRTVGDSVSPQAQRFMSPFGRPDNFPWAVANRLGLAPTRAIYSLACGNEPQKLVGEMSARIRTGEMRSVLIFGAEALATQAQAQRNGWSLDWSEAFNAPIEDRGKGTEGMMTPLMAKHGLQLPVTVYPVLEHARRKRLGHSRDAYTRDMSALFERFNRVAVENPYAVFRQSLSAADIATISSTNRLIADPYTKAMVAKDSVNQGAALLLTSEAQASTLGIPRSQWVYLHGYADVKERPVLEREDLGDSVAMRLAYQEAMRAAGTTLDDLHYFDLYSCFPVAVSVAMDALGMTLSDPRSPTVTGGLPYFGGAGNNYSTHALVSMISALRRDAGAFGLVGANGGFLSKHSVGVYSTRPKDGWKPCVSDSLQARVDSMAAPQLAVTPEGEGIIESYTVVPSRSEITATIVGRLVLTGERFVAVSQQGESATAEKMLASDPLGQLVSLTTNEGITTFSF
jgi:acetyl-CoA C-acetyltransferase